MKPLDLLLARRAEFLAAFESSLSQRHSPAELQRELHEFFAEIAEAAQSASSTSASLRSYDENALVGVSAAMVSLRSRVGQLSSRSRAPVLLIGERGVGKRHCARALHQATYPDGRWFEIDSPERTRELEKVVATLRRGSSAAAGAGMTIYVDELGETAPEVQTHLTRLLDEHAVPLRVVASSTSALKELSRAGKLQKELLFRFSNELKLPPLRERQPDIAPLSQHFAERAAAALGVAPTAFTSAALELLTAYSWPGNLSELKDLIGRLSKEFGPSLVDVGDLPALGDRQSGVTFLLPSCGVDLAELERQLLLQALALAGNNQTQAASLLGLTRDQIRYRMGKLELLDSTASSEERSSRRR